MVHASRSLGRRDLDLQVADAIRETSKMAGEVDALRQRREDVTAKRDMARKELLLQG